MRSGIGLETRLAGRKLSSRTSTKFDGNRPIIRLSRLSRPIHHEPSPALRHSIRSPSTNPRSRLDYFLVSKWTHQETWTAILHHPSCIQPVPSKETWSEELEVREPSRMFSLSRVVFLSAMRRVRGFPRQSWTPRSAENSPYSDSLSFNYFLPGREERILYGR